MSALEQSPYANNPGKQLREVVEVIQAIKVGRVGQAVPAA